MGNSSSTSGNNNNNNDNGAPEVPTQQELQQEVVDPSSSMGFLNAWPDSLHVELRDMAEVSFLIYSFAYLLEGARVAQEQQQQEGQEGQGEQQVEELEITKALNELRTMVDATGNHVPGNDPDKKATTIMTVITPQKVETIVKNNSKVLEDLQSNGQLTRFWDTKGILDSLQRLQERIPTDFKNPQDALTLIQYDDVYQDSEIVYAIGKDDVQKRITLVLRGTETTLDSTVNNLWTNVQIRKTKITPFPKLLDTLLIEKKINLNRRVWMHSGFYNAVFRPTTLDKDDPTRTKYQQILNALKRSLTSNPGYHLYVTGHSLGAALATIISFFLACEPQGIPKPVLCVNFAAPRVGDFHFLQACQALESHSYLRIMRVVNDKDSIAVVPSFNYNHVGFQIKLPPIMESQEQQEQEEPELTYPKIKDSRWKRFGRAWDNGILKSLNLSYDHGNYRERVFLQQTNLEKYTNVNDLYQERSDLTGF